MGLIVMFFLKIQGIDFAKNLPVNKPIIEAYYGNKTKDKKIHSIRYFWVTSTIKDVVTKGVTLAITSIGIAWLVIEGTKDFNMLWLGISNLVMFACFGFVSLVKAYDFYNNYHIEYMKEELKKANVELKKLTKMI